MMKLSTMRKVVDTLNKHWHSPIGDAILKYWEHVTNSAIYFRASANFVFRFTNNGKDHFLRFNSITERSHDDLDGEIQILNYLKHQTANTVKPVLSLNDRYVEEIETENDTYLAVVFEGFNGRMYEVEELSKEQFFFWGKALGKLHRLFNNMPQTIVNRRKTWRDHLDDVKRQIPSDDIIIHREIKEVEEWSENTTARTGIIHFDFELDNLHWCDDGIKILDFDDSACCWYGADIAYALRDLFENGIDINNPSFRRFMEGYSTEFEIDADFYENLPMFMRFHDLYTYTRIRRSLDYKIDEDTPEWLIGLNGKLTDISEHLKNLFSHKQA